MKFASFLTPKEEEVMNLLWQANEPMSSMDILNASKERTWKDNYLKLMTRSLLEKGLIQVNGLKQYNTHYARMFEPAVSKEEYLAKFVVSRGIDSDSLVDVTVAMADEINISNEGVIESLEGILQVLRKKSLQAVQAKAEKQLRI